MVFQISPKHMKHSSYFTKHQPNIFCAGHATAQSIPDMVDKGLNNIETATDGYNEVEGQIEAEDLEVE
jgi:hypothetical protein